MSAPALALRAPLLLLLLTMLCLTGCSGVSIPGFGSSPQPAEAPTAAPASMAGRWLLSSPGHGQCVMMFAAAPNAAEGTIAPQGGCPGKFFTSRKWTVQQGNLIMRDHNGQPLAQLSGEGASFEGKATSGEAITLTR